MKEKIKKLSNEEFKLLVGSLRATYRQFCFSKIGHREIKGEPWKNFENIWTYILINVRHYYLINFAKIFDKESYYTKNGKKITLSIFRAISRNKFSEDDLETIEKIKLMRNELLAHLDSEAMLQGKKCEEDYGLDFEGKKIKSLISKTFELINQIRGDFGYPYELNQDEEKDYIEKEFDEWYKVFEEKYNRKN